MCMESIDLPKEITEAITAYMPRDRDMRHQTAKLIKEAILDDLLVRKLEELTGTCVDEALDIEESFISAPYPCPHNAQVNLVDRLTPVSYNGSIFQLRDAIEWEGGQRERQTIESDNQILPVNFKPVFCICDLFDNSLKEFHDHFCIELYESAIWYYKLNPRFVN